MMATLTDAAFDDDDWLYEVKWDGYRVEAVVSGGRARIWTRNRVDAATYFPDLAGPRRWIDAERGDRGRRGGRLRRGGPAVFQLLQEKTGLRGLEMATAAGRSRMRPR